MLFFSASRLVGSLALVALIAIAGLGAIGCSSTGALIVTGGATPNATIGVAYNSTLTVSNGTGTYMWSVQNLPPGITASGTSTATLTLSGTPTTAGEYTITVTVTDTKSRTDTYTGTITVAASAVLTINGSLPFTGTVGTPYTGTLTATGGVAPYTWVLDALPTGVTATGTNSATVTVSGTPTASGSYLVAITLTDSANGIAKSSITVVISSSATLAITGELPATGAVGAAYAGSLTATGGTAPYTWSVSDLPAGVTASGVNAATVSISGTPTTTATYDVSALVTDSKSNTALYSVTVVIGASEAASCTRAAAFTSRGNEAALSGRYAFTFSGADATGLPLAWAGSFTMDGNGGILGADADEASAVKSAWYRVDAAASSYSFGPDDSGCVYLAFSGTHAEPSASDAPKRVLGGTAEAISLSATSRSDPPIEGVTLNFTIGSAHSVNNIVSVALNDSTVSGSGQVFEQDAAKFDRAELSPRFAFGIDGWYIAGSSQLQRAGMAGSVTFDAATGELSSGVADDDIDGVASGELMGGRGILTLPSNSTGRGTGTFSIPTPRGEVAFDFAYYVVDAKEFVFISADPPDGGNFLLTGRARAAATPAALSAGEYLFTLEGVPADTSTADIGSPVGKLDVESDGSTYFEFITGNVEADGSTSLKSVVAETDSTTGRTTFSCEGGMLPVAYLTAVSGNDGVAGFLVGAGKGAASGTLQMITTAPAR